MPATGHATTTLDTTDPHGRRARLGTAALAASALLFLLYPVTRPWHDEATAAGALASMGSNWWVASHLFAMAGFVLVPLGLLALRTTVRHTRAEAVALAAAVTMWIGAGLTLPYYGAEDFALHTLARQVAAGGQLDLVGLAEDVRLGAAAATTFVVGLALLGVGAVLAAVAARRSGLLHPWSGIPFALGFVLFVPQFYLPAAARIAHGVLVAAGCLWLAVELRRISTVG